MSIVHNLVVLEMLFINLYTSYVCSKKKTTPFITWAVLIVFTVAFIAVISPIISSRPSYGNGNGLAMLTGFLYIIPLKFLYNQPLKYTVLIMCSSWIYTMLTFSFAFRLGYMLPEAWFAVSVLLTQTFFYVITLPYFLTFVRDKFIYILHNVDRKSINSILVLSFLWLYFIIILNYAFVEGTTFLLELLLLFIFAYNVILSYRLFFSLVAINKTAQRLNERTKRDALTKLGNREKLTDVAQKMIDKNNPFSIIFVDLDNFKSVNDRYGHAVGDLYLIEFVNSIKKVFKTDFFRMSGDEFVFLYEGNELDLFCAQMENMSFHNDEPGVPFYGLSSGYASFPTDADNLSDLLHLADIDMYQKKKEKHRSHRHDGRNS
ncbi:MAG: GGDEF domain-containing protein [Firmicutes bacterium]|nr:GGDEF domain-containing protein [Bacillota bacterium]